MKLTKSTFFFLSNQASGARYSPKALCDCVTHDGWHQSIEKLTENYSIKIYPTLMERLLAIRTDFCKGLRLLERIH